MNKFKNPCFLFFLMQLVPLLFWLVIPRSLFNTALQNYNKSIWGWSSTIVFVIILASFYFGYKSGMLVGRIGKSTNKVSCSKVQSVMLLHRFAIILSLVSVGFIVYIILNKLSFVNIVEMILSSKSNYFKGIVYSSSIADQILIMGRHLILTSLITWFILRRYGKETRTLPLILIMAVILFLFTSSRLTVMSIILVTALFYLDRIKFFQVCLIICILLFVFGVGVITRSANTWAVISGSNNIFVIVLSEFLGYFISPINYSVAFVEKGVAFNVSGVLNTFSFVFTVLNVNFDSSYLHEIIGFYNPSLNQIGLVGQWYVGYGPFLFLPSGILGFASGLLYMSFNRGKIFGLLFYPLIYIALFDSFRGFLLFQNIIAANLIFIIAFLLVRKILSGAFKLRRY